MKRYGRYDARTPRKADADEEVAAVAKDALDYLDQHRDLFLWKSEITLRYQRALTFWSVLIITVFGLGLQIDRIAGIELKELDEFQRLLVNAGVIAVLLYHWVMYQVHEYHDRFLDDLRSELVELAFASKLKNAMRRADEIGRSGGISEELAKRGRAAWEKIVKGTSPTTFGLLRLMGIVPPLLFLAAMVVLSLEYGAVNILFMLVVFIPPIVRWIERKLVRRRALRDDG